MASLVGHYQHEKNENLDEYFKALGVPYVARKMMGYTKPRLEIEKTEDDVWTIRTITLLRTIELQFSIGQEFEEAMASGVTLKNIASMGEDGNSIILNSTGPNEEKVTRTYEVKEDELILTMTHAKSGQVAKRYFKRIQRES